MNTDRYAGLPPLPDPIRRLAELALDTWWSWHYRARDVFRMLDYPTVAGDRAQPGADAAAAVAASGSSRRRRPAFLALYDSVLQRPRRRARRQEHLVGADATATSRDGCIAYLSAEFALHQSLPIYAGGLGVLAGDTCKEASDLGVPLVGVGFMYPQGYFHQHVSAEGWQQEVYERLDWARRANRAGQPAGRHAVRRGRAAGRPDGAGRRLGRARRAASACYLLDTDLPENAPWDRELSARLYGGNQETRIQQEIVLGFGGVRALHALGIEPSVWHLNEGHAAFVAVQRIRERLDHGVELRRGGRGGPPDDGLHDPHAGAGRPRRVPVPPRRGVPGGRVGHRWASTATSSWRSARTTTGAACCST